MSARSHAQDAVLAWRRRGLPPPGVDSASAVASFSAAPDLEEIILKACDATANDEREAFAPLISAARGLAVAHRAGMGSDLTSFQVREMAVEDVCEKVDALDHVADIRRRLDAAPTGEMGASIASVLGDERKEEAERLARLLEEHDGLASGLEAARLVRQHAGIRARYEAPAVTELEGSEPRVQGFKRGGSDHG